MNKLYVKNDSFKIQSITGDTEIDMKAYKIFINYIDFC